MGPLNPVLLLVYMCSMITHSGGDDQEISEEHNIQRSDDQSEEDLFPIQSTSTQPQEQIEPERKPKSSPSVNVERESNEKKMESENKKTTIANSVSNTEKPRDGVYTTTSKEPDQAKKNVGRAWSTSFLTSVLSLAGVWWLPK